MASVASDSHRRVGSDRRTFGIAALVFAFISLLSIVGLNLLHTPAVFDDLLLPQGERTAALVGHGRLVRGDEYLVETPVALSQARGGRRETMRIGTQSSLMPRSRQDADVHAYAPGPLASMVFRPLNLWFLVFPATVAVIARQWSALAVGLVAFSMFIRAIAPGLDRVTATLLAVSTVFSPLMMWWFTTTHHLGVAFGVLACSLMVLRGSRRRVVAVSAIAGYVAALGALTTYPAFFLGSVLVSALCMAPLWWRSSDRALRFIVAAATAAVAVGSFWFANRAGLHAVFDTVYPGQRVSASGEDSLVRAMSGPFSRALTDDRPTGFGNQTEVASPLYLFPAALIVLVLVAVVSGGRRAFGRTRRPEPTGPSTEPSIGPSTEPSTSGHGGSRFPIGAVVGLAVLGGWASGLLPTPIGRLIGLGGVPGARTSMGQLVACTALGAWLVSQRSLSRSPLGGLGPDVGSSQQTSRGAHREMWVRVVFWGAIGMVTVAVTASGLGLRSKISPSHLARREVVLYTLLFVLCVLGVLLLRSSKKRALVAAGLSLALSAGVHPLSLGLGPEDRLARNLRSFAQSDAGPSSSGAVRTPHALWAAHEDVRLNAVVVASGLDSLSGVYFVPDLALWNVLDPDGSKKRDWNRYAHVVFRFGAGTDADRPPSFRAVQADAIVIDIGLCRPELARLELRYVLSFRALEAPCVERRSVLEPGGVHVTRVRDGSVSRN